MRARAFMQTSVERARTQIPMGTYMAGSHKVLLDLSYQIQWLPENEREGKVILESLVVHKRNSDGDQKTHFQ